MSEFRLYPIFTSWLINKHIAKGQPEVKVYNSLKVKELEVDILSIYKWKNTNKFTLTSIEVKNTDFDGVFSQARTRTLFCDYNYIAFPINEWFGTILFKTAKNLKSLRFSNVGMLIYDDMRHKVWEVVQPTKAPLSTNNKYRKTILDHHLQETMLVEQFAEGMKG